MVEAFKRNAEESGEYSHHEASNIDACRCPRVMCENRVFCVINWSLNEDNGMG